MIGSNNQIEEISRPAGKIRGEFERFTGKDVSIAPQNSQNIGSNKITTPGLK